MLEASARRKAVDLDVFVRHHNSALISFAFRLLHQEDLAKDCVQNALLRAHAALRNGASPDNLRAWLYRLTYHAAIDRSRHASIEKRDRPAHLKPLTPVPKDLSENLECVIGAVSPELRAILYLRYAYGFSYEEMESVLGLPASSLRVYAARALEKVQRKCERKSDEM